MSHHTFHRNHWTDHSDSSLYGVVWIEWRKSQLKRHLFLKWWLRAHRKGKAMCRFVTCYIFSTLTFTLHYVVTVTVSFGMTCLSVPEDGSFIAFHLAAWAYCASWMFDDFQAIRGERFDLVLAFQQLFVTCRTRWSCLYLILRELTLYRMKLKAERFWTEKNDFFWFFFPHHQQLHEPSHGKEYQLCNCSKIFCSMKCLKSKSHFWRLTSF